MLGNLIKREHEKKDYSRKQEKAGCRLNRNKN